MREPLEDQVSKNLYGGRAFMVASVPLSIHFYV
jgi:hypothetical protein